MWGFIKYCLYCMWITISASFGDNPSGLTWKSGVIALASFEFGNTVNIFNTPGFRNLYAIITIWAEFVSSYLFEKGKSFLQKKARSIH